MTTRCQQIKINPVGLVFVAAGMLLLLLLGGVTATAAVLDTMKKTALAQSFCDKYPKPRIMAYDAATHSGNFAPDTKARTLAQAMTKLKEELCTDPSVAYDISLYIHGGTSATVDDVKRGKTIGALMNDNKARSSLAYADYEAVKAASPHMTTSNQDYMSFAHVRGAKVGDIPILRKANVGRVQSTLLTFGTKSLRQECGNQPFGTTSKVPTVGVPPAPGTPTKVPPPPTPPGTPSTPPSGCTVACTPPPTTPPSTPPPSTCPYGQTSAGLCKKSPNPGDYVHPSGKPPVQATTPAESQPPPVDTHPTQPTAPGASSPPAHRDPPPVEPSAHPTVAPSQTVPSCTPRCPA
jgi:hypothetical protein